MCFSFPWFFLFWFLLSASNWIESKVQTIQNPPSRPPLHWSSSCWKMSYSIYWCSGSYIGVWGSVTHLDTSLHSVCSISVSTTTSFCVYVHVGHSAPLHLVMRVVFISPMWFSTHPFQVPPLLWFPRIRTTSTLFRTHPSLSMQQSTRFLPVSSSTLFYQPLCSSLAYLSPVFSML